jgi:hypothetical protein
MRNHHEHHIGYRERHERRQREAMEADGIVVAFSGRVFLTMEAEDMRDRAEAQIELIRISGDTPENWIRLHAAKFARMYARGDWQRLGKEGFAFCLYEKGEQ